MAERQKKFLDYDDNNPGYGPSVAEVPYEAVAPAAAGSNKSLSCKVGPFRFALTDWGFDYVVTDGEPYRPSRLVVTSRSVAIWM